MNRQGAHSLQQVLRWLVRVPRLLGLLLVRVYQLVLSPLWPATCRFYPSCSAYCATALTRHGLLWGSALTVRRLARCHPWNPGGVDDVPEHGFTGRDGVGRAWWNALRGRAAGASSAGPMTSSHPHAPTERCDHPVSAKTPIA